MKKIQHKVMLCLLAALSTAFVFPISIHASKSTIEGISAESAVLYSYDLNEVLYEKDPHRKMPIASTTKIMTALTVLSSKSLDEVVTVPQEACGIEGSSIYLSCGETLTIKELLQALMLQSANDAAVALAIATDGSIEAFARHMNSIAAEMGLTDTHFANPHGLDHPEHYSSAYDLAIITAKAFENQDFRLLSESKTAKIPGKDNTVRFLTNHNKLLRMYEGAVGVKTGFTKKSGRCLVGAAERDGITLISVTLKASNDWNDHQVMFNHGFSLLENKVIAQKGELQYRVPVIGGNGDDVLLSNAEQLSAVVRRSNVPFQTKQEWNRPIYAPIRKGEVLGNVYVIQDNRIIAETSLVAENTVNKVQTKGKKQHGRKNQTSKILRRRRHSISPSR